MNTEVLDFKGLIAKVASGTSLEVEIFGERFPATVHGDGPLWDPENERLRA